MRPRHGFEVTVSVDRIRKQHVIFSPLVPRRKKNRARRLPFYKLPRGAKQDLVLVGRALHADVRGGAEARAIVPADGAIGKVRHVAATAHFLPLLDGIDGAIAERAESAGGAAPVAPREGVVGSRAIDP